MKNLYSYKRLISFSRISLFIIYFWFGFLKVLELSPASELVKNLFEKTIPFMSFNSFLIGFGVFECIIGILFLIKGVEKIALSLFTIHILTTLGPLILLTKETWTGFLIPSMEGQYIIKNLALMVCAFIILGLLKNNNKNNK